MIKMSRVFSALFVSMSFIDYMSSHCMELSTCFLPSDKTALHMMIRSTCLYNH